MNIFGLAIQCLRVDYPRRYSTYPLILRFSVYLVSPLHSNLVNLFVYLNVRDFLTNLSESVKFARVDIS